MIPTQHNTSRLFLHVLLYSMAAIIAFPFLYMIVSALRSPGSSDLGIMFPRGDGLLGIDWSNLGFDNFRAFFASRNAPSALLNSVFYASASATLASIFAAMTGYALARLRFVGRGFVFSAVLAALIIPGPLLLAPLYTLLYDLGLLNSYAGLILPGLAPAFGVYLFRQATISSVPMEIIESARIDGCGEFRIFFAIAFPLLKPMVSAFVLITFLGAWNNFLMPQIILSEEAKFPLATYIAQLRGLYGTDYGLIMAATLISVAPVMLIFFLLQRDFISGLTAGAVKG
ncbi:MAG: carbohydrate ABC transporter permease [Planctomycetota bacterium]